MRSCTVAAVRCCLNGCSFMGQFACLLPAVAVVAVSKAPSPESDPHSPLPVEASVIHCITIELIGQKFA